MSIEVPKIIKDNVRKIRKERDTLEHKKWILEENIVGLAHEILGGSIKKEVEVKIGENAVILIAKASESKEDHFARKIGILVNPSSEDIESREVVYLYSVVNHEAGSLGGVKFFKEDGAKSTLENLVECKEVLEYFKKELDKKERGKQKNK
jgi:hypothetical protein